MWERVAILESPDRPLAELADSFARILSGGVRVERLRPDEALARTADGREPLHVLHESIDPDWVLVASLRRRWPEAPVLLVGERDDALLAQHAVQAGVADVIWLGAGLDARVAAALTKLARLSEAERRVRHLDAENERLHASLQGRTRIVGASEPMRRLLEQIERVARVPRPILITGERGTGKELVAHAIHVASGREPGSMVTINCAALGDSLLESELFGHERGAFTGADRARPGKFEQADGGTLFLDEIGNMPLPFQQKILRVVEYGTFTRVGGDGERKTSARVLAASNADLPAKIERGEFLSDLYDRLAFEVVAVPPLRERPGDVDILARAFLEQFAEEIPAFRGKRLADSALALLRDHPFPGNVRELKNIIERAAYRDTTNEITPEDIGLLPTSAASPGSGSFTEQLSRFARQLLERSFAETGGNGAEAARRLGLSYDQLRHYRRKYGLHRARLDR